MTTPELDRNPSSKKPLPRACCGLPKAIAGVGIWEWNPKTKDLSGYN